MVNLNIYSNALATDPKIKDKVTILEETRDVLPVGVKGIIRTIGLHDDLVENLTRGMSLQAFKGVEVTSRLETKRRSSKTVVPGVLLFPLVFGSGYGEHQDQGREERPSTLPGHLGRGAWR